ncbi:MAG: glycosyltransferase family 4 protein [Desulfobacterales bacterium]
MPVNGHDSLKICLLSYRSNPHSGGQGVYLKNLSRALKDLGHQVEVICGPPDPCLDADIPVVRLPCLDLYDPADPFRVPSLKELCHPLNLFEWLAVSTMGFPEPFLFGLRAYMIMRNRLDKYDIVHDNQSLSYGIWAISKFIPTVATIHHPITVDREIAMRSVSATWKKMKHMRWYSFLGMQKRVARTLPKIITVSNCAREDISRAFKIPTNKFRIAPNGINTAAFRPKPAITREKNRVIVTNSADIALKGLYYLLEAVAQIAKNRHIKLIVVGKPKKNGGIVKRVEQLGIEKFILFTGRIGEQEFVEQYARASIAVVPSVYEGFGLPAGEAMACGVPVVSTTGGALPEVVGDAGVLVPPADPVALANAITALLDDPGRAAALGHAGYVRVQKNFTWQKAAEATAQAYKEAIFDHGRF